jgi:hypothetical protein
VTSYKEYVESFKCIRGLSNLDALCPECKKKYSYMERNCKEWRKKIDEGVCGCGGAKKCICGYEYHFCSPYAQYPKECPFCGRKEFEIKLSDMYLYMQKEGIKLIDALKEKMEE